jgi:XTP/dITP diphosphohydrolase
VKLRIHLATGNRHKAGEFADLARLYPVRSTAGQADARQLEIVVPDRLPAVVEDTGTFVGNARKKARALKDTLATDAWVLADDSGVEVAALGGAPGVESAYYAGPQADAAANLRKLVEVMREIPAGKRQASFRCVLVLLGPGGVDQLFEGRCDGALAVEPSGRHGFGYDPLFMPTGLACTYAELGEAEKNRISHRALAWVGLVAWLGRHFPARIG